MTLLLWAAFPALLHAQTAGLYGSHPQTMPGRLVLKLKPEHRALAQHAQLPVPALEKAFGIIGATGVVKKFPNAAIPNERQTGWVDLSLVYEVEYSAALSPERASALVASSGCVVYAEPLYQHSLLYQPNDPLADSTSGSQYYLRKIRAFEAWNITRGDTNQVIGIIDTGTKYDHPDLQNKIKFNWADPINGIDDDNDGYVDNFRGWDFSNNDNDATTPTNNGHGVPVTGPAAGHADNGTGIAGTGFHSLFMPVKVYPSGLGTGLFRGYEGIVYAADMGVTVMVLAWGDSTPYSGFQQDVINYAALNKDVVVVSAAGNTSAYLDYYPASYDNVLSVAGTDSFKIKSPNGTYSHKVDVSAPGIDIMTTIRNSDIYGPRGGSSFAAPQVAGTAALVRSRWPNLTAQQVAEQIRITADQSMYSLPGNQSYTEMLGRGFLDMYMALTDSVSPSIRNISKNIDDQRPIYSGDTISLTGVFKNFLRPASGITVSLSTTSSYITFLDNSTSLPNLGTLTTAENATDPFRFVVAANTPTNEIVRFRFAYSATNYTDYQYFDVVLNPDYVTLDTGPLQVTLSAQGTFGYNEQNTRRGRNTTQGVGVVYQGGPSLLFEGALMIGSSNTRVSDAARSKRGKFNKHFLLQESMHFVPAALASQQATGLMQDTASNQYRVGVEVRQTGYAWQQAPHNKYVIVEYHIRNNTSEPINDLYAGLFADWDITMYSRNAANWDAANRMGYVYSLDPGKPFAGIVLLGHQAPSVYSMDNFSGAGPVIVGDSFSVAEKYFTLSNGVAYPQAGLPNGSDVMHVVAGSLGSLAPNDTAVIAFAILAGDDLADLQTTAAAALDNYPPVFSASPGQLPELPIRLFPVPTDNQLSVMLGRQPGPGTFLRVLNSLGQEVLRHPVNTTEVRVTTAQLPEGMYLLQVVSGEGRSTKKFTVVR